MDQMNKTIIQDALIEAFAQFQLKKIIKNELLKAINEVNADDIQWITVRGNHIPLKKDESKEKQIKEFFDSKKADSNKSEKDKRADYEFILKSVKENNAKTYTMNEIFDLLQADENFKGSIDELKKKINDAESYNSKVETTDKKFSNKQGFYTGREAIHKGIISKIFKNAKSARPEKGKKPTFIFLGGRGGSGKSKFDGLVYNRKDYIVLDADAIKEMLPEYKGYNAFEVHEESSHILNKALEKAQKRGLNVVLDATMKTKKSAESKIKSFQNQGYNIEMYYMHLPREKAASRAFGRFMGERGRYVPFSELMKMKDNEQNFDELKKYASKWAFYNNDVPTKDDEPILVKKNY